MARERSIEDLQGAVRRMMRATAKRVAGADEFELAEFKAMLETEVAYCLAQAVAGQREIGHKSWQAISEGVSTTRQAAQMRYGSVKYELWDIEWYDLEQPYEKAAARATADVAGATAAADSLPHDSAVLEIERISPVVDTAQSA